MNPTVPQMSPPTSLTVRAEHLISPAGHRLNSWFIVDGATVVATMKDLGPGTEALAYKLAASLDLLAALKNWQNFDMSLEQRQNVAMAAISKAEHTRHEGGPYVRV